MEKYRKIPTVIHALQITQENSEELLKKCDSVADLKFHFDDDGWELRCIGIHTINGWVIAHPGEWLIRGIEGEWYPCRDSIFQLTYEEALRDTHV